MKIKVFRKEILRVKLVFEWDFGLVVVKYFNEEREVEVTKEINKVINEYKNLVYKFRILK